MPEVRLTFLDGEVMRATADLIDFEEPVIKARATETGSNNEKFTVPLSSLKYIVMEAAGGEPEAGEELGKVVIHFIDHEVLRAYAGRDTLGGPYGVIYTLVEPEGSVRRRIGVPYTAVKAIFEVKSWDGSGRARPAPGRAAPKKAVARTAAPKKAAHKKRVPK